MKFLITVFAVVLLCGCAAGRVPTQKYISREVEVIVMDRNAILSICEEARGNKCEGLCAYETHPMKLYVPYSEDKDKYHRPLPDFDVLGHEMWHSIVGDFH